MIENTKAESGIKNFIGYEYEEINVPHDLETIYADGYKNFGWNLDGSASFLISVQTMLP